MIDRQWFPAAHRPGFHVIRPDSHWFLEQFVPFDYSSQANGHGRRRGTQSAVRRRPLGGLAPRACYLGALSSCAR